MGTVATGSASRAIPVFPRGTRVHRERVLIVQEEKEPYGVLRNYLENKGYEVATAGTCAVTEQIWRTTQPDIALIDYSLSDGNALALIPRLKAIDASIPIIILTGYGSIDLAVEAVKLGAEFFLPRPAELVHTLRPDPTRFGESAKPTSAVGGKNQEQSRSCGSFPG